MIMPQTSFYESFIKICSVIYYSIENQRAKGGCNIFNIENVSLDKYLYSNIETSIHFEFLLKCRLEAVNKAETPLMLIFTYCLVLFSLYLYWPWSIQCFNNSSIVWTRASTSTTKLCIKKNTDILFLTQCYLLPFWLCTGDLNFLKLYFQVQ